ncbi:FtsX domain-containing protein [Reticulomyxa filosa]|uniref:FtsX domain-containing protein n=1 Tax=Reticulomyxa filosa TaxID=46433 RepID=X6N6W3_RETFI|nr:FtsX domain-containing protein [Reticulomyxa filosa]|eukprot:ETO21042.1 FtsX domain-containing protein [Reticulomyxa filosa]
MKLKDLGFNLMHTTLGVTLSIIGFVCLYVIPYSFANQNLSLLFWILNLIFLGMLLGLALIVSLIQPTMNVYVVRLACQWGYVRKLKSVLLKHMHGHAKRNAQTGLMIIISTAFVVFCGSMVTLQLNNIVDLFVTLTGADLRSIHIFFFFFFFFEQCSLLFVVEWHNISLNSKHYEEFAFNETYVRETIESNAFLRKHIVSYTFVSFPMSAIWSGDRKEHIQDCNIGPLGGGVTYLEPLVALADDYCDTAYCEEYLLLSNVQTSFKPDTYPTLKNGRPDPIRGLYLPTDVGQRMHVTANYVPPTTILSGYWSSDVNEFALAQAVKQSAYLYNHSINVLVSTALSSASTVDLNIPLRLSPVFSKLNPFTGEHQTFESARFGTAEAFVSKLPGHSFRFLFFLKTSKHQQKRNKWTKILSKLHL